MFGQISGFLSEQVTGHLKDKLIFDIKGVVDKKIDEARLIMYILKTIDVLTDH